jgi:hypothetical protein
MKIYTTLRIGDFHTNYCEDFFVIEQISTKEKIIAVLDGCTMGTESVFASILTGKILRKIAKKYYYQDFVQKNKYGLSEKLKLIISELFSEIKQIKNKLGLETNELLTTIIIGLIDSDRQTGEFLTIGDGVICNDGQITEYEQNNKPDYLAYHLDKDFDRWFESQKQKLSIKKFKDLSICTDGIFTFKNLEDKNNQMSESEIIEFLLKDIEGEEFDNFLDRKIKYLQDEKMHIVTDDLSIIRLITEPKDIPKA